MCVCVCGCMCVCVCVVGDTLAQTTTCAKQFVLTGLVLLLLGEAVDAASLSEWSDCGLGADRLT